MGRILTITDTTSTDLRARSRPREQPQEPEPLWRDVLGTYLRDVRGEQGRILTGVAAEAGVSPQYLSEIERGRKEPSSEILSAVAGALGLTLLDITKGVAAIIERATHDAGQVTAVGGLPRTSSSVSRPASSSGRAHLRLAS
ncbi:MULTISPECIES: helix-turn-helix transcriptional regulator [Actinomycetes]|uniref:helix-turn-helix domain-containing protein n=1 Tax=Actinomycetes TaxID=1760 RepID=UPI0009DCC982|nr:MULTISPECIES: helix-turn-helix transcriptional regulator [Actinomycetes]